MYPALAAPVEQQRRALPRGVAVDRRDLPGAGRQRARRSASSSSNPTGPTTLQGAIDAEMREAAARAARRGCGRRSTTGTAGQVAEKAVAFSSSDRGPRRQRHGAHAACSMTDDFADFRTKVEDPVTANYRGIDVYKCGPWNQGPVFLQQLTLLEGFDLGEARPQLGRVHPHRRRGGQAGLRRPRAVLRRPGLRGRAAGSAALEGVRRRAPRADRPERGLGRAAARRRAGRRSRRSIVGDPRVYTGDTTHVDVVDAEGNMFAATPSGGWIPSSPVVPGSGSRWARAASSSTSTRATRTRWRRASGRAPR